MPDSLESEPLPDAEQDQPPDPRRKVWDAPRLETLDLSSTESGNFPFPIEQFIQNPFTS